MDVRLLPRDHFNRRRPIWARARVDNSPRSPKLTRLQNLRVRGPAASVQLDRCFSRTLLFCERYFWHCGIGPAMFLGQRIGDQVFRRVPGRVPVAPVFSA